MNIQERGPGEDDNQQQEAARKQQPATKGEENRSDPDRAKIPGKPPPAVVLAENEPNCDQDCDIKCHDVALNGKEIGRSLRQNLWRAPAIPERSQQAAEDEAKSKDDEQPAETGANRHDNERFPPAYRPLAFGPLRRRCLRAFGHQSASNRAAC